MFHLFEFVAAVHDALMHAPYRSCAEIDGYLFKQVAIITHKM
jgi:hypothetical protein